jgi:hypothetical protein
MPLTLDSTAGSATAESFASVAYADAYFAKRRGGTAWLALTSDQKIMGLVEATDALELLRYNGQKSTSTQALSFPRTVEYEAGLMPVPILQANCELALYFATLTTQQSAAMSRRSNLQAAGVTSYRIGDASETFSGVVGGSGSTGEVLAQFPARVRGLISGWVNVSAPIETGRHRKLWWPEPLDLL